MDVLQQIFRSNGRSVNHLQHQRTEVGEERGRCYVRGANEGPFEVVTVYLTDDEIDRLVAQRHRRNQPRLPSSMLSSVLDGLSQLGGLHDSVAVSRRTNQD